MASYLVTGATGFLGSHLVSRLVEAGHRVRALVRVRTDLASHDVERAKGDILDPDSLAHACEGIDGVFHAAGLVSRNPLDAERLHRVHVTGTKNVIEAARKAGAKRLVFVSTSGTVALSEERREATEDDPVPHALVARFPYYRSKLYAEQAALASNDDSFSVVAVNPTLLLGPGDVGRSSTEDVRAFLDGKVHAVPKGGIAFVDARDAALAAELAMDRGISGERYLVNGANYDLPEFFERLARVSGRKAPSIRVPRLGRAAHALASFGQAVRERSGVGPEIDPASFEMAQYCWFASSKKAARELGFSSRDPMLTLRDTVLDLERRGVVWPRA